MKCHNGVRETMPRPRNGQTFIAEFVQVDFIFDRQIDDRGIDVAVNMLDIHVAVVMTNVSVETGRRF